MRRLTHNIGLGIPVLVLAFTAATASGQSGVVIDTFSVSPFGVVDGAGGFDQQYILQNGPGTMSSFYQAPVGDPSVIIGNGQLRGERDIILTQTGGALASELTVNGMLQGGVRTEVLDFSTASGVVSSTRISYDGLDGAAALNPIGLGGVDLTNGGMDNGLILSFPKNDKPASLLITIWEDQATASEYAVPVSVVGQNDSPQQQFVAFSDFIKSTKIDIANPVADFTSVGAVEFEFGGTALDIQIGSAGTSARIVPEPSTAVSLLIGCLSLLSIGSYHQRRRRRRLRAQGSC